MLQIESDNDETHSNCSSISHTKPSQTWFLVQGLGDTDTENTSEGDTISTISFDKMGKYLSLGDIGGRIIVFAFKEEGDMDSVTDSGKVYPSLQYITEFQSHEPEFNFQKSIEIPERLTCIEWVNRGYTGATPSLVTANDKVIKLFQMRESKLSNIEEEDDDYEKKNECSVAENFANTNQIVFPKPKKIQ